MSSLSNGAGNLARALRRRGVELLGGPARARVILVLGGALGLQGADLGTVTATANDLEQRFGISNTGIGLLVSVTALAGALGTVPIGVLTDRVRRTRLMAISVFAWTAAMLFTGAALSFVWLIAARVVLGVVSATSGPTVASLSGDFFPARSRAHMLGYILGGELIGTGIGVFISGELSVLGWRWAFWWLVIPGAFLARLLWRLPEPARDGQTRLRPGQTEIPDEHERAADRVGGGEPDRVGESDAESDEPGRAAARARQRVKPRRGLVLREDPTHRSLRWAVRYVLAVPTNRVLIVTSALGYFYFSGLRSFAIIFVTAHYGISKAVASPLIVVLGLGALAGVYLGGRGADRLLDRDILNARVIVPIVALAVVVILFTPAILVSSLAVALPLLVAGAGFLGAVNPPLDAARLDIIHPAVWGRAEGVRTFLRGIAEAGAPLLFGWVSQAVFGGSSGLEYTFLVFLLALVAAAGLAFTALHTYPHDAAAAAESHHRDQQS